MVTMVRLLLAARMKASQGQVESGGDQGHGAREVG